MSANGHKIMAVVVAAGSGNRFGGELPKQYCNLMGLPVVMHTINNLRRALLPYGYADNIILAINPDCAELWNDICRKYRFRSPAIAFGGSTRWHTVSNSLSAIPEDFEGIVLIHDAARPLVDQKVVERLVGAIAAGAAGAVPTVAVTDSLRQLSPKSCEPFGSRSVDRKMFRAVQTPQAFDCAQLRKAYSLPYSESMTDDASVMQAAGFESIAIVDGNPLTLKITHPADIATAEFYLQNIYK